MGLFDKNNWDVNLWIAAQVAALIILKYVSLSANNIILVKGILGILIMVSVVAVFFRINKIKKFKTLRQVILIGTAIMIAVRLALGIGFDTDFAVVGGLV